MTSKFQWTRDDSHLSIGILPHLRSSKPWILLPSLLMLYSKYTEERRENKSDILACWCLVSALGKGLMEDELWVLDKHKRSWLSGRYISFIRLDWMQCKVSQEKMIFQANLTLFSSPQMSMYLDFIQRLFFSRIRFWHENPEPSKNQRKLLCVESVDGSSITMYTFYTKNKNCVQITLSSYLSNMKTDSQLDNPASVEAEHV